MAEQLSLQLTDEQSHRSQLEARIQELRAPHEEAMQALQTAHAELKSQHTAEVDMLLARTSQQQKQMEQLRSELVRARAVAESSNQDEVLQEVRLPH